jgi:putative SOS response-associated peptidase YedK
MCGKITQMVGWAELLAWAEMVAAPQSTIEAITPMRFASVIRLGADGAREAVRMRWGLVPPWESDPMMGTRHIHARAETIETKRTFRDAFARRRGLVVVHSFNEGREVTPTRTEQHIITPRDGAPLAIAVIWERWIAPDSASLLSFAMVTVAANALIGTITDRMPALIAPADWPKWLGEEPAGVDELKAMLVPIEGDWEMQPAEQSRPPKPPKPESAQRDLF